MVLMHNASWVEARTSQMTYCILSEPVEGHARRATPVESTSVAADEAADPAYPLCQPMHRQELFRALLVLELKTLLNTIKRICS